MFGDGFPERLNLSTPETPAVFGPDKLSASLLTIKNVHQFAEVSRFADDSVLFQTENAVQTRDAV